jgi:hypothetical protein
MRIVALFLVRSQSMPRLPDVQFGGAGRRFGSQFVADICGALKLFVKVAGIHSDAF